jgi:hypothetical protein
MAWLTLPLTSDITRRVEENECVKSEEKIEIERASTEEETKK